METKTQSKLPTLSTGHHHHYIHIYKIFLRIYDIILSAICFFFEVLNYLLSICGFFMLLSICLTAVILTKVYFDTRKLIRYVKNSRISAIFVSIIDRISSKIPR